jgi:hypothetical protein
MFEEMIFGVDGAFWRITITNIYQNRVGNQRLIMVGSISIRVPTETTISPADQSQFERSSRGQGHVHARVFTALFASFLLFLGFLGTARNARADDGIPALPLPAASDAEALAQQVATDQASSAAATAGDSQQSNVVVVIRINSPGNDFISQPNVISVGATAANGSSTNQNQAPTALRANGTAPALSSGNTHPVPAKAGRGRVILAAYASSSARSRASAPVRGAKRAPASPTHSTAVARRGAGLSRGSGQMPGRQVSAARHGGSPRASHDIAPARAEPGALGAALGTAQSRVASWLGGERAAASAPLAADPAKRSDLVVLTLAALLTGLLACAMLTWLPQAKRFLRLPVRG